MGNNREAAEHAVDRVKTFLHTKSYKEARSLMKTATELDRQLYNGLEILIVCEMLYYGNLDIPNFGIDWYSVLHLHPSATDVEVNTHCRILIDCLTLMKEMKFPGVTEALGLLNQAKYVLCDKPRRLEYDRRRKEYGFVDCHKKISNGDSSYFSNEYFKWRPPSFSLEVVESFHAAKRRRTSSTSSVPTLSSAQCEEDGESYPWQCLAPEVKKLKDQVFDEMPQRPHYGPLNKYSGKVREGAMVGFDIAFISLSEEIRKSDDPESFLSKLDGFMEQLAQLEEMGYNVDKLRERLETLRGIVNRRRASLDTLEMFDVEVKENKAILADRKSLIAELKIRISELEAENEQAQVLIDRRSSKIDSLQKDLIEAANEFTSTAKSMWK